MHIMDINGKSGDFGESRGDAEISSDLMSDASNP